MAHSCNPALGRLKHKVHEFKESLNYIVRPASKRKEKKIKKKKGRRDD
jgi:hypothetical protein